MNYFWEMPTTSRMAIVGCVYRLQIRGYSTKMTVLEVGFTGKKPALFGYLGSSSAFVVYMVFLALIVVAYTWYFQSYKPSTWPGFAWKDTLEWKPFWLYLSLGFGGMLAMSEWIFWEIFSLIVGSMGQVQLGAHTIATQVITVGQDISLAFGIALSIRIGFTLPRNPMRARSIATITCFWSVIMFGIISWMMYAQRNFIFANFTDDAAMLATCQDIWWLVSWWFFNLSIFNVLAGIAYGLGLQWTLGKINSLSLWGFGLPAAFYFALVQEGGIKAAWMWINPPYILINCVLLLVISRVDWDKISEEIRIRESMNLNDEIATT